MSPMKVRKPFNAINNATDGYETSKTDCWRPIKAYITKHKALPK